MLEISTASTEYVRVQVQAREDGADVDPTGDTAEMAFTTGGAPQSGDWQTASWETDSTVTPTAYYARCLVGPAGAATLTAGLWTVWLRVTDNPEVIVRRCGTLRAY